ncbi:glycosyltransferase family 2 protein [Candidatus Gottesmanbacteria bacterium]|nr:glycosyltransferase family 2 protein [Candidatus Gottesmanbacteria bacterium]
MISAIVLSHNDQDTIRQCLSSVLWCDEVIVVDDNSTDATIGIAKKTGAKVCIRALNDDFSEQRNFGLFNAKGDWVLFVDSDEAITEDLQKEIRQILNKETGKVGYFVKRNDYFMGSWLLHGETANVRLLRLAKKESGCWQRPVHEVWVVKGSVGELNKPFHHFPHPNVAQFLEKINSYSSLQAKLLYRDNVRVYWWHIIAYPAGKFFVNYIWRLGFLDGTAGAVMAIMMSFHSFLVRAKLWQLRDRKT